MDLLTSLLWSAVLDGGIAAIGVLVARTWGVEKGFARLLLAAGVVAWAWVNLGVEVLGTAGLITRIWMLGWVGVGIVVALAVSHRVPTAAPVDRGTASWEWTGTLSLVAVWWAMLATSMPSLAFPVKVVSDGPIYHLYFAARWWKAERLFLVAVPFGESAATYFPANGDLWFTWLTVAWGGDRLARLGQAPFLAMSALAIYRMARVLGASRLGATLASCWFVGLVPVLLWSFEPIVDTISAAGYLAAAAFLLEFALEEGGWRALALSGLSAGLAWGTKMPAIVFIVPLLAVGVVIIWARRRALHRTRDVFVFLACSTFGSGYWLVRNAWLTGNPVYPLHVSVAGRVLLRGWYETSAMSQSTFYIPREWWGTLVDILTTFVDFRLSPFWLAAVLCLWLVGKKRTARDAWAVGLAIAALVNIALYWLVIPYRTQQRFIIHAFGLAAVPLALLFDRAKWLRVIATVLLYVHFLTTSNWPFIVTGTRAPWSVTGKIPSVTQPLIRWPTTASGWLSALETTPDQLWTLTRLINGLAAIPLSIACVRMMRQPSVRSICVNAAASAALLVALAAWYYWVLEGEKIAFPDFRDHRGGWIALEALSPPEGTRVAYAGNNLPYYFLGSNLRNHVEYVNIDDHDGWLLHDYHRTAGERGDPLLWPTPRPGWDRIHPDFSAWLKNLQNRNIRYLVVTRAVPEDGNFNLADRDRFPIERVWADAHPEWFTPVYGVNPRDRLIKVYRVEKSPLRPTESTTARH